MRSILLAVVPAVAFASPVVVAANVERLRIPLFVALGIIFTGIAAYALWVASRLHAAHAHANITDPQAAQIEQHVLKLKRKGHSTATVREKLLAAGWDAHKVDVVLHGIHKPDSVEKLMFYVQQQMLQQKPKEEIRQVLRSHNWPEKMVNLVLQ